MIFCSIDQPSFVVFENLESLLIKTLKGEETLAEIQIVQQNINTADLNVELATFKVLMEGKQMHVFYKHNVYKHIQVQVY